MHIFGKKCFDSVKEFCCECHLLNMWKNPIDVSKLLKKKRKFVKILPVILAA